MGAAASQITSLVIVYSTFYTGANQRKHQSSTSLAFVREFTGYRWIPAHKWPVTRKIFPFHEVIVGAKENFELVYKNWPPNGYESREQIYTHLVVLFTYEKQYVSCIIEKDNIRLYLKSTRNYEYRILMLQCRASWTGSPMGPCADGQDMEKRVKFWRNYCEAAIRTRFSVTRPFSCKDTDCLSARLDFSVLLDNDVIMSAIASQITSLPFVYSTVYLDADQTKHQSSKSLAFCAGKSPVTGEYPAQKANNAEQVSIW